MNRPKREHLKLAYTLMAQLESHHLPVPREFAAQVRDLVPLCHRLFQASSRLDHCHQKGWHHAVYYQSQTVAQMTGELASRLSQLPPLAYAFPQDRTPRPFLKDLVGELDQLESEFDSVCLDLKERTLSVTTDPITLDGLYLGPFKILLDLGTLAAGGSRPQYQVIAIDPNPAHTNELVTHPHVRDEELCEGDAAASIQSALLAGRVCDFFMLVRSVLQHYNPDSPYVAIGQWEGTACSDCGHVVSDDDRYNCEGCENDFCDGCIGCCRLCDESRCPSCLKNCAACSRSICGGCSSFCRECEVRICDECVHDDLCPACREKEVEYEPSSTPAPTTSSEAA